MYMYSKLSHDIIIQPRPQGAFLWLWGRGPKAREKRPGDEVDGITKIQGIIDSSELLLSWGFMHQGAAGIDWCITAAKHLYSYKSSVRKGFSLCDKGRFCVTRLLTGDLESS